MLISIMGAQRTGKTTLAKTLAGELGFEFVPVNVSNLFKRLPYYLAQLEAMTGEDAFWSRLEFQDIFLVDHIMDIIEGLPENSIIDRNIGDVLAYSMHYLEPLVEDDPQRRAALDKHIRLMRDLLDYTHEVTVLVRPGIEWKDEDKNTASRESQELVDSKMVKVFSEYLPGEVIMIPPSITVLEDRVKYVKEFGNLHRRT